MKVTVSLFTVLFCLFAGASATNIRGGAKSPSANAPGAAILKTIRTLETAEALMKKTQAAMQAKIDKLNANMAVGLDKHIDGTVNKIVNAYHLKEKEAIANAATNRLNQWASGGKNKTAKDNVTMPTVDPAKIVAEEQAEEDKKPKESTLAVCKKDLARGKMMLENAIRTNADPDIVADAKNVRDNAQICLLENHKEKVNEKIDEAKTKMSSSGWNTQDMSPTQMAEWKQDMERNMKLAMRLDQAIGAIQGAIDSRVSRASEEKTKQMEKNAEDTEKEAEEMERDVEDPALGRMKEENEKSKAKALEASRKLAELKKSRASKQRLEQQEKAMQAQAKNEEANKKAMASQEDELRAKHALELAKAKGESKEALNKMEQNAKKLKEETQKKEAAAKANEEAAKAAEAAGKKKMEAEFNKKQMETQKKMDKQAEENEKAMKRQEQASKREKKTMEEKAKAESRVAAAKASGNKELLKMARMEEEKAKKGEEEAEKTNAKATLKAELAMEREKAARMEMDKQAEKSAEEIKNLREQLSDVSAKEALSRGKAEGLEKISKCCEGNKFDPKTLLDQVSAIAKASMQNSNKGMGAEDMAKMMQAMRGAGAAPAAAAAAAPVAVAAPPPQKVIIEVDHVNKGSSSNDQQGSANPAVDAKLGAGNTKAGMGDTKANIGSQTKYEDHIQKAVDSAVDRLLTKTKERRAAEEKKEEKDREEAERVERRRLELEAVNQKADEATKKEKAAEEKAKDASADEELMKAQMKKQKAELKKLKANSLKQQQMITEMGEKAKEKEDRLKDISDTF